VFNFLLFSACGGSSANAGAMGDGCYSWPVIKQIVWLFSWALNYLYRFLDLIGIANIGLVIILFTLIIKFLLLPLTIKQQKFTKLTSVMQPELQKIQNKYKGAQGDQYAMQAMQAETRAVYAKYGVSQAGGCLQSFIQFPILIAMYGALRGIPTAVENIAAQLRPVADIIANAGDSVKTGVKEISSALLSSDGDVVIKTLYSLPIKSWDALQALFTGAEAAAIANYHETFVGLNSFLGWDISQSPWNLMRAGGIGILAVLIPLIAGFSQWLSFKLTQTKQSAAATDSMATTSKTMGLIMPLFSVYICFTMSTGLGLYWCMSSLFQVVLQILINRHYRKIDMDKFIEANLAKGAKKAETKREKSGVKGSDISSVANISTRNIDRQGDYQPARPMSIAEKANMNVMDTGTDNVKPASNSLAAKAGLVQEYNEEHPDENPTLNRKKYKK
jgi:YidC/Oxa1 family membrane protein insertase